MPSGCGVFFLRRDVPLHARELPRFYRAVLKQVYVSFGEEALRAIFDWCEAPQRMRNYAKEAFNAPDDDEDIVATAGHSRPVHEPVNWLAPASEGLPLVDILSIVEDRAKRSVDEFLRVAIESSTTDVPPALESDSEPEGEEDTPPARKTEEQLEANQLNKERSLGSNYKDILNASRKSLDNLEQILDILIEQWRVDELARKKRADGHDESPAEKSAFDDGTSPKERVVRSFNMCLLLDIKYGESVGVGDPDALSPRRV